MNVAEILKGKGDRVLSVRPADSIEAVIALLAKERIGALLVREADGRVAGVVSERDIVSGVARAGAALLKQNVTELMTRNVVYCTPRDSIQAVMERMTERRFRHLPVLDGDRLVGIISIGDVVKARISEAELESRSLKEYIATG